MLEIIKGRCYIATSIYDDEIQSLINACILDCVRCGIKESVFNIDSKGKYNNLALNCVTNYVKAYRGNDRSQTEEYLKMYTNIRDEISLHKEYMESGNVE